MSHSVPVKFTTVFWMSAWTLLSICHNDRPTDDEAILRVYFKKKRQIFMNNSHFILFLSLCIVLLSVARMSWQETSTKYNK